MQLRDEAPGAVLTGSAEADAEDLAIMALAEARDKEEKPQLGAQRLRLTSCSWRWPSVVVRPKVPAPRPLGSRWTAPRHGRSSYVNGLTRLT